MLFEQPITGTRWDWDVCAIPDGVNPYDTRSFSATVRIVAPNGTALAIPAFAIEPHTLRSGTDHPKQLDVFEASGERTMRIRWIPDMPGRHIVTVSTRRGTGPLETGTPVDIHVAEGSVRAPGMIRFGENGSVFRRDGDETSFFPIGANVCWPNMNQVFSGQHLDDLFLVLRRLRDAGGTVYRLWANAHWGGLSIDWATPGEPPVPFGAVNEIGCARLDHIMEESERLGLAVMFCIDNMNIWAGNQIATSSYARAQGGPCDCSADYFRNAEARAMTREKMKYIAARWGYSRALWCWEFWNEIDGTGLDKVHPMDMMAWHQEMAKTLRAADPYTHPITTSTGHPLNFPPIWRIPEIEFTQTHHYGYMDSEEDMVPYFRGYHRSALELFGKPHLFGEIGVSWTGGTSRWESDGRTLHNLLWSSALLAQSCGAGFFWSWDGYIHANDLYHRFQGLSRFLDGETWHNKKLATLPIDLEGDIHTTCQPAETLKISTSLSGNDFPQSVFTLRQDGSVDEGCHLIPNIYYGQDMPFCHLRVTFVVDTEAESTFTLRVWGGGINHLGGNALEHDMPPVAAIRVDGETVLEREVVTTKPQGSDALYTDDLSVPLQPGHHVIEVENVGGGTFSTGHLLLTHYRTGKTLVDAQGVRIGDRACLWIRDTDYTWAAYGAGRTCRRHQGLRVRVHDLQPGRYRVRWWDTREGTCIGNDEGMALANGTLTVEIPEFEMDIAAKIAPFIE